ncbi:phage tail-like protein [Roseivirga pacifica]|uniref:Conserved hypothetical phage tail region protein n=1 Tax=Roseivirga pacifica TaxID=1267423 RepID=A0A1I0RSA0_9BACT|nr:phage tail protein [Roseivirga pacifica]MCO6357912.1 phage tail protein [Roseivirga pacifica]MCO6366351.1 phage tail protein [Roseivirga pacifica]MCO6370836.1 phage tail protein [Roseivirga pacifica]MCO6373644.1 phage tail protein [Roseivirga pacifica]MCO6380625.1 phage tail protein [Roseivirga pacifica]
MADDGSAQGAIWPLPKFYFKVTWDGTELSFQEVSGLDAEAQIIEYRHGNSPVFSTIKMPGIKKYSNVTMKKGVFTKDNSYFDWFNQIKMNVIKRITVVIQLCDESGNAKMTWTLNNAWPTKITPTDMKSDGNEAAIESIEIAYETLKVEAA